MFSVFSYVKPTLLQVAGMPLGWMPVVLSLFGVGMVGGNLIGSRLADKALMPTIGGLLIWSAAIQLLYVLTCHHPVAAALTVVLVGSAVAIGPALQIRLMDVAGDAQALAAALNHSAFNLANALGAWLGGLAIDAGLGYPSTGWVGTLLSLGGFGVFWWARQDARARRRRPAPRWRAEGADRAATLPLASGASAGCSCGRSETGSRCVARFASCKAGAAPQR
jgi:DHA1 family inner membrane transport protein